MSETPKPTNPLMAIARRVFGVSEFGILFVLVLLIVLVSFVQPNFASIASLSNFGSRAAWFGIIGLGVVFQLSMGEIDLSTASIYGLTINVAAIVVVTYGIDPWIASALGIAVGIGLGALNAIMVTGFKQQIAERLPNVEVIGAFDVKFDQTQNFSAWRSVYDANQGAIAYVGFCENDLPSLVRLKESTGGDFQIASIGINPDGLDGIERGVALAAIGQKPFMQGYVAMRAMLQNIVADTSMPRGWIDVGPELVTSANAAEITAREETTAQGYEDIRAFYADDIDALFADLPGSVQSYSDLLPQ